MKLRNKLIPIISVATLATTIAPLTTSCGKSASTDMIDVVNGYIPSTARALPITEDISQDRLEAVVQDLYIEHVKNNPRIMAEDMAWWESKLINYRLYAAAYGNELLTDQASPEGQQNMDIHDNWRYGSLAYDIEKIYGLKLDESASVIRTVPYIAKFNIKNISFGTEEIVNPSTQKLVKVNTISCDVDYEYDYELFADTYYAANRYNVSRRTKSVLTSSYKNIPFNLAWNGKYGTWTVETIGWKEESKWMMEKILNWNFSFNLASYTTDTIKDLNGNVDTYNYDNSSSGYIDTVAKINNFLTRRNRYGVEEVGGLDVDYEAKSILFNFGSYHLFDVMGKIIDTSEFGKYINRDSNTGDNGYIFAGDVSTAGRIYLSWSYIDSLQNKIPAQAAMVASNEDIILPLINTQTGDQVGFLKIAAEDNTEMLHGDRSGSTFTCPLDVRGKMYHGVDVERATEYTEDIDFSIYKVSIPAGTQFKVQVTYGDYSTDVKTITLTKAIAAPTESESGDQAHINW